MSFDSFFQKVTEHDPFPYQRRLAGRVWPDLLDIPTGLGKTAAVVLAWLWKSFNADPETPRRLVYCLPMRVLVEQTERHLTTWLEKARPLFEARSLKTPTIHLLMGGQADASWTERPEDPSILIGTQDMLLSRALMRGYGMSRYQWPVHFALLHNDCLWVLDEVQLMGPGLATSAQLDAFRRMLPPAKACRTLWVSATLNRDWLATVDLRPHLAALCRIGLDAQDHALPRVEQRVGAIKTLSRADVTLAAHNNKVRAGDYAKRLAGEIKGHHQRGTNTLVIVNRVERAQALYQALGNAGLPRLLLHARFRPAERRLIETRLRDDPPPEGRVIVATQAVEAGVDLTSKILFTELAPWPSMVQRFGRCNRYGEENATGGSTIFWVDTHDESDLALPYEVEDIKAARRKLADLPTAAPRDLPITDEPAPLVPVLRRKDLLDLFNTDPDLSGFDVDISSYIRDTGTPQLQVYWRDYREDPNDPVQGPPVRDELCPISIGQAKGLVKRKAWLWDCLSRRWRKLVGSPRPGMTLMLDASEGGYHPELGFTLDGRDGTTPVEPVAGPNTGITEAYDEDWRSCTPKPVALAAHLTNVAGEARALCRVLGEKDLECPVVQAARWHDLGKAHPVFQATLHACPAAPHGLLAKSPCKGHHQRPRFRHELASMLAWLEHGRQDAAQDLIAYLIAAHHGKVRMGLRALPDEQPEQDKGYRGQRFARGIWEGDMLPPICFDGEAVPESTLRLAVMELGEGPQGPSWIARTQRLLKDYGPFRLAWLETLVRVSDWRASKKEQEDEF
jgi:CRISPR-associated endonuclease/helicase Cas3